MDNDVVIKVEGLHKKFCRALKRSMFYGSLDVARGMFGISYDKKKLRTAEFFALEDINFEIKRGETFGLIGANGCGKTTLLRLINGIFPPDSGKISIKGRVGALIAVGAGFHPHMTGRENVYLNGTILGMTKNEIDEKFDDIVAFADIGEFLDAPVSTYSSGMHVRLGFAIAIHSNPDIVLVDEILAVGDAKFQRKCLDKIREMRKTGVTFILVTHNLQNIEAMCNRVLLMDHGKQLMIDAPNKVIPEYELLLKTGEFTSFDSQETKEKKSDEKNNELDLVFKYADFGTFDELVVKKIRLVDNEGQAKLNFESSDSLSIEAEIDSKKDIENIQLTASFIYIEDKKDNDKNLVPLGIRKTCSLKKGLNRLRINFGPINLATGEYKLSFHLFDESFTNPYSQGHYGYFKIKGEFATLLRAGRGAPSYWANPEMEIN